VVFIVKDLLKKIISNIFKNCTDFSMFSSIFGTKVVGATVIIVVDMELPNYFFLFFGRFHNSNSLSFVSSRSQMNLD